MSRAECQPTAFGQERTLGLYNRKFRKKIMKKNPSNKGQVVLGARLLILVGICLLAGGLLRRVVADFMPVETPEGYFRIILVEETRFNYELAAIILGTALFLSGMMLQYRGR